jgi:uncharacterized protein YndB with AHSA1/START domain
MNTATFTRDIEKSQIIIERTFSTTLENLWRAYTEKEKMEKWFGPGDWPMTVDELDFRDGGYLKYHMTGPDGTKSYGWTEYILIDSLKSITSDDSFCDENGVINTALPQHHWVITFTKTDAGTKLIATLTFESPAALQQIIDMGFEAGYGQALDQLNSLVAH